MGTSKTARSSPPPPVSPDAPLSLIVDVGTDTRNLTLKWNRPIGLRSATSLADRKLKSRLEREVAVTWVDVRDEYVAQATPENCAWLEKYVPDALYSDEAAAIVKAHRLLDMQSSIRAQLVSAYLSDGSVPGGAVKNPVTGKYSGVDGYTFKRESMGHQVVAFECARHSPFYGLTMDMGTGKSKVLNDVLSYQASKWTGDRPMRALILCPRSVLINWVRELAMDITVPYKVGIITYLSSRYKEELMSLNVAGYGGGDDFFATNAMLKLLREKDVKLQVVIANYEVLKGRSELLKKVQFDFAATDESHWFKSMSSKRAPLIHDLGKTCSKRYILTGTPLTQSPHDLFSQFEFLAPEMGILGQTTYHAYKRAYSDTSTTQGGREVVDRWVNLGGLLTKMQRYSFTIKKEQCLDLPEKTFEERYCQMTPEQKDIYDQVASEVLVVLEGLGAELTIQNILVQYMRLAQVTSGFVKSMDGKEVPIPGGNVKIKELMGTLEAAGHPKALIWARFKHEIRDIEEHLSKAGVGFVTYTGDVSADLKQQAVDRFASERDVRYFVGTQSSGGIGINLTAAEMVNYVSNSFSLGERLQSEARADRIGQTKKVLYMDYLVEDTIDELIYERLQKKRDMANFFNDPQELAKSLKEFLLGGLRKGA